MGREMDGREMDAALAEVDQDGGGDVDFDEFARWWAKQVGRAQVSSCSELRQ
jgi:Ca2+-binding EF-hand superfamily protein